MFWVDNFKHIAKVFPRTQGRLQLAHLNLASASQASSRQVFVVLYFAYDEQIRSARTRNMFFPVSCEARHRNDALCFSYWLGHYRL